MTISRKTQQLNEVKYLVITLIMRAKMLTFKARTARHVKAARHIWMYEHLHPAWKGVRNLGKGFAISVTKPSILGCRVFLVWRIVILDKLH